MSECSFNSPSSSSSHPSLTTLIDHASLQQAAQHFNHLASQENDTTSLRLDACRHIVAIWESVSLEIITVARVSVDGDPTTTPLFPLPSPYNNLHDARRLMYASQCAVAASLIGASLDSSLHSGIETCANGDENPPLAAATRWLDCDAFRTAISYSAALTSTAYGSPRYRDFNDPWCIFASLYLLALACSSNVSLDAAMMALTSSQAETLKKTGVFVLCDAVASEDQLLTEVLCSFLKKRCQENHSGVKLTQRSTLTLKETLQRVTSKLRTPEYFCDDDGDWFSTFTWEAEEHCDLVTIFVQWLLSRRWKQSLSTVVESLFGQVEVSFLANAVGIPWMMIDDKTINALCGPGGEGAVVMSSSLREEMK